MGEGRWKRERLKEKAGSCRRPGAVPGEGECHGGERRGREGSKRHEIRGDTTAP